MHTQSAKLPCENELNTDAVRDENATVQHQMWFAPMTRLGGVGVRAGVNRVSPTPLRHFSDPNV